MSHQKASYLEGAYPTSWEFQNRPLLSNIEETITRLRTGYAHFFILPITEKFQVNPDLIELQYDNFIYGVNSYPEDPLFAEFVIFYNNNKRLLAIGSRYSKAIQLFINNIELDTTNSNTAFNITYIHTGPQGEIIETEVTKYFEDFKDTLGDYYPFLDAHDMAASYLNSRENILILTGEPGTGKTSFVKWLWRIMSEKDTSNQAYKIYFIKDKNILSQDSIWAKMIGEQIDLVILDDLDDALTPRENSTYIDRTGEIQKGNLFVDKFLSISDGVFNLKTKFIITTNRKVDNIDGALLRPGRCFDVLEMRMLRQDEALTIWADTYKLSADSFYETFDKAQTISQALLRSEYERVVSQIKNYIKEPGISIRQKLIDKELGNTGKTKMGFRM